MEEREPERNKIMEESAETEDKEEINFAEEIKEVNEEQEIEELKELTNINIVRKETKCGYCNRINPKYECSTCNWIKYCSISCQKNDWALHKKLCKKFQKATSLEEKEALMSTIKPPTFANNNSDSINLEDFEVIKNIGEGNFSSIKLVEHKSTRKRYALKIVEKAKVQRAHKEGDILAEKHCLTKLINSKYCVKLVTTFKDDFWLYFLLEYIDGGELWEYIRCYGFKSEGHIRYYFYHIAKALNDIHHNQIVHRDVKPENIMLCNERRDIRFIDFGSANDESNTQVRPKIDEKIKRRVFEHFVGTPEYMAPECLHNKFSTYSSDIWSLGCMLYQFYTGWTPFAGQTDYLVFLKSSKEEAYFPPGIIPGIAQNLIKEMINLDSESRISLDQILNSEYVQGVKEKESFLPIPSLSELALVSLKHHFQNNLYLLRVRKDDVDEWERKMLETIRKAEELFQSKEGVCEVEQTSFWVKGQLQLLIRQLKAAIFDRIVEFIESPTKEQILRQRSSTNVTTSDEDVENEEIKEKMEEEEEEEGKEKDAKNQS